MILELIENNFVGVTLTLCLILFILTNNNFEERTNRLFLVAAVSILIVIIEEAWEAQLALSPVYQPLRVPLSALGYALRPALPFCTMLIARKFRGRQLALLAAPLVFNTLVAFSSLFCGLSFSYSADNKFVRGPLGYTPFIVAAFYVVGAIALLFITYKGGGRMEMMILTAIVLLAFLATIMESRFHLQFIQCPGMATSLTFFYMFLHSSQNNRDPLTEALTRRRFYLDSNKNHAAISAVISLDLNDLKKLNDQKSHLEGDRALCTVAKIVKRYMGLRATLYRVGGDEFMILCCKMDEENVQKIISMIRRDLEETDYRCAIGYAMKPAKMSFKSACHIADNAMYENKRQMKGDVTTESNEVR